MQTTDFTAVMATTLMSGATGQAGYAQHLQTQYHYYYCHSLMHVYHQW